MPSRWEAITRIGTKFPPLPPLRIACDVTNPLLGTRGAAATFAPQKGLRPGDLSRLEHATARLTLMLTAQFRRGEDLVDRPGAGGRVPASENREEFMRNLAFSGALASCLLLAASGLVQTATAQPNAALVIQGGTLIDGNGGAPVANSVIVIQGNRITAVGRAGQVQVPAGAQVRRGETIAQMGSTGRSTGSHLHFELHENGRAIDPLPHLRGEAPAQENVPLPATAPHISAFARTRAQTKDSGTVP